MATKTTILSPNVSVVSFSQGAALTEIISAVNDEIVKTTDGHGWLLHDAAAGSNTKCYKAMNKDGISYKFLVLDWSTGNSIRMCGYSAWNEVSHLGTNPAGMNTPEFDADVVTTDRGNIYLFISPRWLALCVKQFSSPIIYNSYQSGIGGVFEIARDNPDDTVVAGYPPFCFLTTGATAASTNSAHPTLLLPKSLTGTGNQKGEISTVFGKTNASANLRLQDIVPDVSNHFSGKDWALTPYVHGPDTEIRGRMFGLKIYTKNKLNFMDKVAVTCDADFMYDATAAAKEHYLIPGGYAPDGEYDVRFIIPA